VAVKLNVSQSDLNNAIQITQRAVSSKSVLPILSGIHFSTNVDYLDLYSTDLDISIKCRLAIQNEEISSIVFPARLIGDIIKNLPDGRIELSVNKETGKANIVSGNAKFNINTLSAEDFPTFPTFETGNKVMIEGQKLSTAIKQVVKSASRDETRPVLCGILLTIEKGRLSLVATDSYRLSIYEAAIEIDTKETIKVIVPARSLEEVLKTCGDKTVEIGISKNQMYFNLGHVAIISRLIEGSFPPYQKLLPDTCESRVKLNREEFLSALKRVALLAQNNALIKIRIEKDNVRLENIANEMGSAQENVPVENDGEQMEIAFNANYLIDGLNSINEDFVYLELNNPIKPGIIKPASSQDFIYLVMPVRIG
jgi:DNA polymerase-3 subunit beta